MKKSREPLTIRKHNKGDAKNKDVPQSSLRKKIEKAKKEGKTICCGDGLCLEQTDDDYVYKKHDRVLCLENCKISCCPTCEKPIPKWVMQCNGGECMGCAIYSFAHQKRWELGDCFYCGKRLVRIGSRRENGANHRDWDSRKYHKSCLLKLENGE